MMKSASTSSLRAQGASWRSMTEPVPLALFPVRLETRWFQAGNDELELRIRIFPDAIHLVPAGGEAAGLPVARGLPGRFAIACLEGRTVLASADGATVPPSVPLDASDAGWLASFPAAEAIGLAVRVKMTRAIAQRVTTVVALGARDESAATSATLVGEILAAHVDDHGGDLLAPGTATNHTASTRAGTAPPTATTPLAASSDGARLARALGLAPALLARFGGAGRDRDPAIAALHRALWPATWGYYCEQIVAGAVDAATIAAARDLFVNAVRADGPWPSLRIGRQPYGILPIAPLARWRTAAGQVDRLAQGLAALRPRWLASGAHAAVIPRTGDSYPALLRVLALRERGVRWAIRQAATMDVALSRWNIAGWDNLDGATQQAIAQQLAAPTKNELAAVGLPAPTAAPLVHADEAHPMRVALLGTTAAEAPAYVAAMARASITALRRHELPGSQPRTLLYALLRHATLRELVAAADDLLHTPLADRRDLDVAGPSVKSTWSRVDKIVPGSGGRTVWELLDDRASGQPAARVAAHRAALARVATMTGDELAAATAGALDLASHRLDAWTTALATRRVDELRSAHPAGLYLGAYGWVSAPPVPATAARDGGANPSPSQGHILAPSLDHARTAAILRAGFAARPTGDLAIALTASRVRAGRALLSALRVGRGLAEVLGFTIERACGDVALIAELRRQFPLAGAGDADPNRAQLDGLAAWEAWSRTPPPSRLAAAAAAANDQLDGCADLLLAEAIHQRARGLPDRATAVLSAVAAGAQAAPDPDVATTPFTSDATTYRLLWSFGEAGSAWPASRVAPRAIANPEVEGALAALLGDPTALRAERRAEGRTQRVSLADLELCALDVCALTTADLDSAPLMRLVRAALGAAPGDEIVSSPALDRALWIAREVREVLRTAQPWPASTSGPPSDALAALDALAADLGSDSARRRVAALLGHPIDDERLARDELRALHTTVTSTAVETQVQTLSGVARPGATELGAIEDPAFTASAQIEWLAALGRVRASVAALELIGPTASLPWSAWKVRDTERWVVCGVRPQTTLRALVLDTWVEAQPQPTAIGGIAFHHDAPRARAPQCILLAVPPTLAEAWQPAVALDTIVEAIELTRVRLAEPTDVWGATLPAIYVADSFDDHVVASPLHELAAQLVVVEAP